MGKAANEWTLLLGYGLAVPGHSCYKGVRWLFRKQVRREVVLSINSFFLGLCGTWMFGKRNSATSRDLYYFFFLGSMQAAR